MSIFTFYFNDDLLLWRKWASIPLCMTLFYYFLLYILYYLYIFIITFFNPVFVCFLLKLSQYHHKRCNGSAGVASWSLTVSYTQIVCSSEAREARIIHPKNICIYVVIWRLYTIINHKERNYFSSNWKSGYNHLIFNTFFFFLLF